MSASGVRAAVAGLATTLKAFHLMLSTLAPIMSKAKGESHAVTVSSAAGGSWLSELA